MTLVSCMSKGIIAKICWYTKTDFNICRTFLFSPAQPETLRRHLSKIVRFKFYLFVNCVYFLLFYSSLLRCSRTESGSFHWSRKWTRCNTVCQMASVQWHLFNIHTFIPPFIHPNDQCIGVHNSHWPASDLILFSFSVANKKCTNIIFDIFIMVKRSVSFSLSKHFLSLRLLWLLFAQSASHAIVNVCFLFCWWKKVVLAEYSSEWR